MYSIRLSERLGLMFELEPISCKFVGMLGWVVGGLNFMYMYDLKIRYDDGWWEDLNFLISL